LFTKEIDLTQGFPLNENKWTSQFNNLVTPCGVKYILKNIQSAPGDCIFSRYINLTGINQEIGAAVLIFNFTSIDFWNFDAIEIYLEDVSIKNITSYSPSSHFDYFCGDSSTRDSQQEIKIVLTQNFKEGTLSIKEPASSVGWGLSDFRLSVLTCPENSKRKINIKSFECECKLGFFPEPLFKDQLICLKCSWGCLDCSARFACKACIEGYYLNLEGGCQQNGKTLYKIIYSRRFNMKRISQ
jgi:hypothetical protein